MYKINISTYDLKAGTDIKNIDKEQSGQNISGLNLAQKEVKKFSHCDSPFRN